MTERKYFIVWNADRSEGFITDNHSAALNAHYASQAYWEGSPGTSTLGLSFAELYREDPEDVEAGTVEEITL